MVFDEYEDEGGKYVLPEEALQHLISAIVLRGVLDYRNEIYLNIILGPNGYEIQQSDTLHSIETFFENIGFNSYQMLPSKILAFKREIDQIPAETITNGHERTFICPICGNTVHVRRGANKRIPNQLNDRAKRATCDGCLFKVFA